MKKKIFALVTVALLIVSSINVMAASYQSPTGTEIYTITIDGNKLPDGGSNIKVNGGKISVSDGQVKPGESVTLVAEANSGKKFTGWNISGDYTILQGGENSTSITIVPRGDISVDAKFVSKSNGSDNGNEEASDEPEGNSDKGKGDDSNTSPKTGNEPFVLLLVMIAAGVIAVSAKRKLS